MAGTIVARLSLEGGPELADALSKLGATGQKALSSARGIVSRLTGPGADALAPLASLGTTLARAGSAVVAVGGKVRNAGATLSLIGGAVGGLIVAVAALVKSSANSADQMEKSAEKAGLTIDAYGKLQFAAEQNDVSAEDFTASMGRLNKQIEHAKGGSTATIAIFQKLGISVSDLETQSPDKIFLDLVDGFSRMQDGAEKSALAIELFGRGGIALIPLLNQTRAGVLALEKQFEDLGLGFTKDQAKLGDALNDSLNLLRRAVAALKDQIGLVFAPALTRAADAATQFIAKNKDAILGAVKAFSDAVGSLPASVKLVVAGFVGLGLAAGIVLSIVGRFIQGLGFLLIGMSGVTRIVGALAQTLTGVLATALEAGAAAIGFLLTPIGLTVVAIAALVAALVFLAVEVIRHWDEIKQDWSAFKDGFLKKWEAMKASFVALPAAVAGTLGQIVGNASVTAEAIVGFFASIPDRLGQFFSSLAASVISDIGTIVGNASAAAGQIVAFFTSLPARVGSFFSQLASGVLSALGKAIGSASATASRIVAFFALLPAALVQYVASVIGSLAASFGSIVGRASAAATAIKNALVGTFTNLWEDARSIFDSVMAFLSSVIAGAIAKAQAAKEAVTGKRDGGLVSVAGFDGTFNFNIGGLVASLSEGMALAPVRVTRGELPASPNPWGGQKMDMLIDGQTFRNFTVPQDVAKAMMKFSRDRSGRTGRVN